MKWAEETLRTPLIASVFHEATLHTLVTGLGSIDIVQVSHRSFCVALWCGLEGVELWSGSTGSSIVRLQAVWM
jgi:hypothetical protein